MERVHPTVFMPALLLTAAVFLPFAPPPSRAAGLQNPGPPREIVLSPAERALVLKGKIVLRDLPNPGRKGRTFEAIGVLQGSIDEAVAVLTDFGCYPEYMPNVGAVKLCEVTGPCSVVEVKLHLPLGVRKQYRLRFTNVRDDSGFELAWEKLPWPELKPRQTIVDTSGYWLIRKFEEGGILVVYHLYTDPGQVPLGLKNVAQALAKNKIPDAIVKLRERILSVYRKGARSGRVLDSDRRPGIISLRDGRYGTQANGA